VLEPVDDVNPFKPGKELPRTACRIQRPRGTKPSTGVGVEPLQALQRLCSTSEAKSAEAKQCTHTGQQIVPGTQGGRSSSRRRSSIYWGFSVQLVDEEGEGSEADEIGNESSGDELGEAECIYARDGNKEVFGGFKECAGDVAAEEAVENTPHDIGRTFLEGSSMQLRHSPPLAKHGYHYKQPGTPVTDENRGIMPEVQGGLSPGWVPAQIGRLVSSQPSPQSPLSHRRSSENKRLPFELCNKRLSVASQCSDVAAVCSQPSSPVHGGGVLLPGDFRWSH